jgi:hypothetical protein
MEPEGSLSCLQKPANGPQYEPDVIQRSKCKDKSTYMGRFRLHLH